MKFSDFSNEKYRLNSFSVRIKYQPTVPNFLDSSLVVYQDYNISCTQGSNPYYGDISVEKDGYTAFSATIETPIMGIDHMQSCGFRKNDKSVYGQSDISGTMIVRVGFIKN